MFMLYKWTGVTFLKNKLHRSNSLPTPTSTPPPTSLSIPGKNNSVSKGNNNVKFSEDPCTTTSQVRSPRNSFQPNPDDLPSLSKSNSTSALLKSRKKAIFNSNSDIAHPSSKKKSTTTKNNRMSINRAQILHRSSLSNQSHRNNSSTVVASPETINPTSLSGSSSPILPTNELSNLSNSSVIQKTSVHNPASSSLALSYPNYKLNLSTSKRHNSILNASDYLTIDVNFDRDSIYTFNEDKYSDIADEEPEQKHEQNKEKDWSSSGIENTVVASRKKVRFI
ncbi:hypothetical protein KGF56_001001 [Candida oxycetoniae]|uniref:Uncharacterized protein n=1 Tax=Candida oxycetoniae TaxID=497107 RepID=A0AAI9WZK4_9ASCO|nr:uncharacterized protein KGF56_001001 [Candida oxycetoniae]KAI3406159.2 hypothetical protein KGF56_001001 [Candida oxycetoniae]